MTNELTILIDNNDQFLLQEEDDSDSFIQKLYLHRDYPHLGMFGYDKSTLSLSILLTNQFHNTVHYNISLNIESRKEGLKIKSFYYDMEDLNGTE